jgi:hypothetical protein
MRTRHGRLGMLLCLVQGHRTKRLHDTVRDDHSLPADPGEGLALPPLRGDQLPAVEPMYLHNEGHQLMNPLYKQAACPECCVKHLLAANALLLFPDASQFRGELIIGKWVTMARAVILAQEVQVGYKGNIPALMGALAALEQLGVNPEDRSLARCCRKVLNSDTAWEKLLTSFVEKFQGLPSLDAFAYANLIEAAREAPVDYEERLGALVREALDYFHDNALRDLSFNLLDIAIDIADAYELLPQENADGQT